MDVTPSLPNGFIYLVDDDEAALRAFSHILRLACYEVETFSNPERLLTVGLWRRPACLIVDLRMPQMSGLDLQRALNKRGPTPPILFLSSHNHAPAIVDAMRSGAINFLLKPATKDALLAAVAEAVKTDREALRNENEIDELKQRFARLTPREREVCLLVGRGLQNKEIAAELGAALKTIKVHRARVMTKMEAASVADLVRSLLRLAPPQDAASA